MNALDLSDLGTETTREENERLARGYLAAWEATANMATENGQHAWRFLQREATRHGHSVAGLVMWSRSVAT